MNEFIPKVISNITNKNIGVYDKGFELSVAAMNYIHINANPLIYMKLTNIDKFKLNYENTLDFNAGLCGTQSIVFCESLNRINIPSRVIQIFSIDKPNGQNHVTAESWFKGKWNFFDITFGSFFRKEDDYTDNLLSLEETDADLNPFSTIISNEASLFYNIQKKLLGRHYLFKYLDSDTKDVLYDGSGIIKIYPNPKTSFENINNFIGHYDFLSKRAFLGFILKRNSPFTQIKFFINNIVGNGCLTLSDGVSQLKKYVSSSSEKQFTINTSNFNDGDVYMDVESKEHPFIIYFDGIEVE